MWLLLIRIVKYYYRDVKLNKTETLYKYFNPVGLFIIGRRKRRPTNNMSGLVRHPFYLIRNSSVRTNSIGLVDTNLYVCILFLQVIKLTEQLSEAQNEIRKLSELVVVQETSTNSSSSSFSIEANDAPTDFEFSPMDTINDNIPLYMLDNNYYLQNMEYWDGLYVQF